LGGHIEALATDSDSLAVPERSRRAAKPEERRAVLRLATEFFRKQGIPSPQQVTPVNLTVMELNSDHQESLIGSFELTGGGQQGNLFAIFERSGDTWKTSFTALHNEKDPGGADQEQELLVDRVVLDTDGAADLVTVSHLPDGNRYRIYSRKEGKWGVIFVSKGAHGPGTGGAAP
jgi:hypothetical protein